MREGGHRLDKRNQYWFRFLLPNLNEAVLLELLRQGCCEFGWLLLQSVILNGGKFLKRRWEENWNVRFGLAGVIALAVAVAATLVRW